MKKCKVEFLEPAMMELRGIVHSYGSVGYIVMDAVSEIVGLLEDVPHSGRLVRDKELQKQGYRVMKPFYREDIKVIYRFVHDRVYIYHVIDGTVNIGRENHISSDVSADLFFSNSNIEHLKRGIEALNAGKGVQHELLEVDE